MLSSMDKKPIISAIAALGNQNQIGHGNNLIWHIPDDLKRFKELTLGHVVIMGRKTYESIPEKFRPLPNRTNIVITRDTTYEAPGCIIVHSIEEALKEAKKIEDQEAFIIGGAEIYTQALPYTDKLYLTLIDSDTPGDSFFPNYFEFSYEISREEKEHEGVSYIFLDIRKPDQFDQVK